MKRKWSLVATLVLVELALCLWMYSIVQATVVTLSEITGNGAKPSAMAEALEEQRWPVNGPVTLRVEDSFGTVRIMAGASGEIAISAHKQVWAVTPAEAREALAALELGATKQGNAVKLEPTVRAPTHLALGVIHPMVDVTVTVPVTTAVVSRVLSGGITLSGITGDAELASNRSPIHVNDVRGNLKLQSDSGDVTAEHVQGQIQITSYGGTVRLSDIRAQGELMAKTQSGDVLLDDPAASSIVVESDSGDIRLSLPRETALTVDLQTIRGQFDSQFPIAVTSGAARNFWHGTINGGGPALKVSTHSGNIALELKP